MSWSRRACANPGRRFGTTIPTKLEDDRGGRRRDRLDGAGPEARFEELEARRRRGEKNAVSRTIHPRDRLSTLAYRRWRRRNVDSKGARTRDRLRPEDRDDIELARSVNLRHTAGAEP